MEHTDEPRGGGPLEGIVIADFTRVLAGPYATMLLADMGATVIKVESPGGDDTRTWRPPEHEGVSTYYLSVNRNKRAVALDLSDREDLDTAYALLDRADVFLENFKPGGLAKFGLDPDSVAERWPHLVHASITGFGTASGTALPGYDLLAQAVSGMMTVTGEPDGAPQRSGVAIFDVITGLHAAIGVLGALQERTRSGRGQHLELNLLSSALSGLVNQTSAAIAGGVTPHRMGNEHPSLYPYGPFRAADRELIIAVGNDRQFARLVEQLGRPELAEDPRFLTMKDRNAHRGELGPLLEEALAAQSAGEWFEQLRDAGIPCSPILTLPEGVEFAAGLGLDPVVEVGEQRIPTVRHPIRFSRTPARHELAPPALDADRDWVRAWIDQTPPSTAADAD
ncbi:CoA transferase [Micrococcus luteus]|nr:CoA transferase [Micrococcus luteus]